MELIEIKTNKAENIRELGLMKLLFTIDIMNNPFFAYKILEEIKKLFTGIEKIFIT